MSSHLKQNVLSMSILSRSDISSNQCKFMFAILLQLLLLFLYKRVVAYVIRIVDLSFICNQKLKVECSRMSFQSSKHVLVVYMRSKPIAQSPITYNSIKVVKYYNVIKSVLRQLIVSVSLMVKLNI